MGVLSKDSSDGSEGSEGKEGGNDHFEFPYPEVPEIIAPGNEKNLNENPCYIHHSPFNIFSF